MATLAPHTREAALAPSPAVAPPPGNPRFPLFDSLRAIAVLAVVIFHVTSITGEINRPVIGSLFPVLGTEGLTLFFLISGFLLYRPFVAARARARPLPSPRRYARRRALRIVPAYWTALTVLAIFPGIVGVFSGDWWRYYLFGQLYSSRTLGGGIPVAWTLGVEVSFYLALPLWAAMIRRVTPARRWLGSELLGLGLVAAGGIAVQTAASRLAISYTVADSLLGQCTWFALGMALAVLSVAAAEQNRRPLAVRAVTDHSGLCWLGAAACLVGVVAVLHPSGLLNIILTLQTKQPFARTLGSIALTAALMSLLVAPAVFGENAGGLPRRVLRARWLAWIGLISYGIYLWHLTIAELLGLNSDPGHFSASGLGLAASVHHATTLVLFVLTLGVTVAVAALSYYVIELPFLRRKETP
jgi:peptidoglycan/LPS O-acetylase OafA/YrhL